jgi:PTS system galactitol-specific IIB component
MTLQYRILVVCGTGIATAAVAAEKVTVGLKERGYKVVTSQCHAMESPAKVEVFKPHLIVATTTIGKDLGVPVFKGVPFLTGIGEKDVLDQIVEVLKEVKE